MTRLIRAEFLKLRTTQVWFWLLLAVVAVSGLLVVAQIASSKRISADDVPDIFTTAVTGYIVVYVLGVLGVTTEFRYQTITPTFLQTPSRWTVVGAKLITYFLLGLAYALVGVIVQIAIAVPMLSAKGVSVDFGDGKVLHAIVGVFGVLAVFGIIGLGFGALLRNQVVAVVVGIIFLIVLQPLIILIPVVRNAFPYLPTGGIASVLTVSGSRTVDGTSVHLLPLGGGIVVLLLWAFVPAVIGAAFSMNRDIT